MDPNFSAEQVTHVFFTQGSSPRKLEMLYEEWPRWILEEKSQLNLPQNIHRQPLIKAYPTLIKHAPKPW